MRRTDKHVARIMEIMNTNPAIQAQMTELAERAEAINLTYEQWQNLKAQMLSAMFVKMAERIPEIKQDFALDIYEELKA